MRVKENKFSNLKAGFVVKAIVAGYPNQRFLRFRPSIARLLQLKKGHFAGKLPFIFLNKIAVWIDIDANRSTLLPAKLNKVS